MLPQTDFSIHFSHNNDHVPMEFHEADDFTPMQSHLWEPAALLQDGLAGTSFEFPRRFGSRSPATTNSDPAPNVESINFMTKDMRALVKQIQDLRHLGIEDSKIALPKICVVGDQSTGKSSLIEGMSEIKVPRSAGTCTRCPMEINLSDSEQPWKCSISLTSSHTFSTKQSFRKATKSKPLGPWIPLTEPQDEPFMAVYSKDQVQDAIKRAQLAILNPHHNPADYLPGSSINVEDASTLVKFSPNVVRLDITAPNFPNLSFYDLPGVISQTEVDDEAYLVTIVENLVKHYVSQANCIILLTLPMTDDATNSSAARIVREIKATHRTLGVLTKPDRVEDVSQWTDLLTGEKFRFGHGYYVVRNNPDPKVEHRQARLEEEHFFAGSPWTEASLAIFKSRLGTRNLQNALSQLLLDQIKECLPHVTKQIHDKARRIDEQLSFLPEPVNQNTLYVLCAKLQELKTAISASLGGGSKEMSMLKIWSHIADDFFTAMQSTKPMLHLLTAQEVFVRTPQNTAGDDSDIEVTSVTSAKQTPKRKLPSDSEENPSPAKQALANPFQKYRTEHFEQFQEPGKTFDLLEIRGYNEDWSCGGLHNQIHPKAIEMMNKLSISHWKAPMKIFLATTYKLVKDNILEQVNKVLTEYQGTDLHREVLAIVNNYLEELKEDIDSHAEQLYDSEMNQPTARDRETMQKYGEANHIELRKARKYKKVQSILQSQGRELPPDAAKAEKFVEQSNLGPDPFENEIKMMAITSAYYKVAFARFVDNLCMSIHLRLFSLCKENIYNEIETKLGIREDSALTRCAQLLADDPDRQRRREFLVKEREKLATALKWLEAEKTDSSTSESDDDDHKQSVSA